MAAAKGGYLRRGVLIAVAVALAALVVGAALAAGDYPYVVLGNADPGALVRTVTPLLRLVFDGSAVLCVGGLVFAVGLNAPAESGSLSAAGYAAVRSAGRWAMLWLVSALALVVFDAANSSGQRLADVLAPAQLFGLISAEEAPKAWLVAAVVAAVVADACRYVLRWRSTAGLLVLAVIAVLPPLVAGHASAETGHDVATSALLVHVPVAVVWLGGLLAVLRFGRYAEGSLRRYTRLATVCWVALGLSGLVAGFVALPTLSALTGTYGLVLLGKVVLLLGLGWIGIRLRRAFNGLAVEFGLLALALGLSGVLTLLPAPVFTATLPSVAETLLGYGLHGPPTFARLLLDWRANLLFLPFALLAAGAYLFAVRRVKAWPGRRTASWLAGCLVLLLATSSGLGRYAPAMYSMHISSHMLIAMLAPLLLALGGPLTLLREACGDRPLFDLADAAVPRVLTQPFVVLALFVGTPFLLYFTGLFDLAARYHWAHQLIDVTFFVIGYLFWWAAIGVDPTPRPLPNLGRLSLLLAAMPFDLLFGAAVIGSHRVIGNGPSAGNMYQALALPWVPDLLADQRIAGIIALVAGEVTLFLALVALLLRWRTRDAEDTAAEESLLAAR